METYIWRFRTRQGSLRLHVGIDAEERSELLSELRGCAVVADTAEEFLQLAGRAISDRGGILADILRQPWSVSSLDFEIRRCAEIPNIFEAVSRVLDAASSASAEEIDRLLREPESLVLRQYLVSLISGLDEKRTEFILDLSRALRVETNDLVEALPRG